MSGQIRFDGTVGQAVYGQPSVTLGVYGASGQHIRNVTVTYSSYGDAASFYSLPSGVVIDSVYSAVYFRYGTDDVTGLIYRESDSSDSGGSGDSGSGGGSGTGSNPGNGGGNGGNGGGTTDPDDVSDEIEATDGKVDAGKLRAALEKYKEVTIRVKGDSVSIPASALTNAKFGALLHIVMDNGTYELPLGAVDLEDLADKANTEVADMQLLVGMRKISDSEAQPVQDAIASLGAKSLSHVFELEFAVADKDGKKTAIDVFEQYVKRKIPLVTKPNGSATIALYDPAMKRLSFVPGSISDTEAEFWRTGNSLYTVIELDKSFADIASHWAKSDIELLASKLIVEGATSSEFQPDRNLTRAEFVALAVRAFGLVEIKGVTYFNDVETGDWHSGIVAAAAKAGLIDGYEDGTFRPNDSITREELAAIVVRAYTYAGGRIAMDDSSQSQLLAKWADADRIVWGQKDVAKAVSAGFMVGMTDSTLETYGSATRAQTVAMLKRVLTKLEFID
ncbi:S-layer homology domain-containing protein [Paenibacillus flagellatus]|uniref:S-layer homology domain-containing protein n=1 Tax=Paenibacillus flagellatus TaxID=2211139 RepID=UPI0013052A81|nr:S-layer homology domain-containing protein [Paenibacillus flagellatus]